MSKDLIIHEVCLQVCRLSTMLSRLGEREQRRNVAFASSFCVSLLSSLARLLSDVEEHRPPRRFHWLLNSVRVRWLARSASFESSSLRSDFNWAMVEVAVSLSNRSSRVFHAAAAVVASMTVDRRCS